LVKQILPFASIPQIPWLPNVLSLEWHYAKLRVEKMTSNPIRDKKRENERAKVKQNDRKRYINPIAAASEARKKAMLDAQAVQAVPSPSMADTT
jgi:hypothetical protein